MTAQVLSGIVNNSRSKATRPSVERKADISDCGKFRYRLLTTEMKKGNPS